MSEKSIQIEVELDSHDIGEGHQLYAVLNSAIKSRTNLQISKATGKQAFWSAGHFHLDKVTIFREAGKAGQQKILRGCSRSVLAESYYIEKCGMYFSAKMSLLAKNTQERMLYSMFASDEAVHFNWMSNFISPDDTTDYLQNPFIQLLEELLQKEESATLAYLVQVILEGWGIHHYQALAKNCLNASLKKVFETILKDEARHHASGLILFNENKLTEQQIDHIITILERFFQMIQTGPQMIVAQLEQVKGHLSMEQKAQVFTELSCESETAKKISVLKSFIKAAAYADMMIEKLERANCFRSFTAAECAAIQESLNFSENFSAS
jgi:rubrerythrin